MLSALLIGGVIALIIYKIHKIYTKDHDYFTKRGVYQMNTTFWETFKMLLSPKSLHETIARGYLETRDHKLVQRKIMFDLDNHVIFPSQAGWFHLFWDEAASHSRRGHSAAIGDQGFRSLRGS